MVYIYSGGVGWPMRPPFFLLIVLYIFSPLLGEYFWLLHRSTIRYSFVSFVLDIYWFYSCFYFVALICISYTPHGAYHYPMHANDLHSYHSLMSTYFRTILICHNMTLMLPYSCLNYISLCWQVSVIGRSFSLWIWPQSWPSGPRLGISTFYSWPLINE